mgnify:CR=1 FL=1
MSTNLGVNHTSTVDEGNTSIELFAEGWIDENGEYDGRPIDVIGLKGGSTLLSDDFANAIIAFTYFAGVPTFAADPESGRILARKCSVCQGKNGMARNPEVPNLAGQSSLYLENILKDFRDGAREDRRMNIVVKSLSDDDIKDFPVWFSRFVVTVDRPE